jgi:NAD(P)-dependent dehydrogenase (short-subunit alcohol dehydrogenase family)
MKPARTVMVTGGTGALGRAVVERFATKGCVVHVPYAVERETGELRQYLGEAMARVRLHQCDVTSTGEVKALFDSLAARGEAVEVLANLVGGFAHGAVDQTPPETWARMWNLNATSAFVCAAAAVPAMKAARWGRIINVSSAPALSRGAADLSAYTAAKAAVLSLAESWAKELAPWGITVNAIVPSVLDTPANRAADPGADRSTWLAPTQVADVILFLSSDEAGIVTGTAVNLSQAGPARSGE